MRSDSENGKMGLFKNFEHNKVEHFEKKARDRFENEKRTENEHVRFWGISGKMHMLSREKYLLHMLYGASQDTSRIIISNEFQFRRVKI